MCSGGARGRPSRPPDLSAVTDSNVARILWDAAQAHPSRVAVSEVETGTRLTYAELVDRVARIAAGLQARGLYPGDRVALLLRNSIAYVEGFLGAVAAGLVVVPLNVRLTTDDFRHMLVDSGSAAVISEEAFLDRLAKAVDLSQMLVVSASPQLHKGTVSLDSLATGAHRVRLPVSQDAEDVCSLMYTSGTTGDPKAVMLPHRSWRQVSDTVIDVLRFGDDEEILHAAPLTHGAGFLMLPTLATGGHNVICLAFDAAFTASALGEGQVTSLFMVPSMIRLLLDALPDGWTPSSRLRCVYYAGSPIDPSTLREAHHRLGGRLVQSFAQMESPMFFTVMDEEDHRIAVAENEPHRILSAGRPIEGVTLRIQDSDGAALPPGASGEILARAPQTMLGYWNRPEETAQVVVDGWLRTGDVGYLDEDGYLFVVDRLKDMIVTGGSNVYAREVEEVLCALAGVREAAVVGLTHRIWGEAVTAVLVPESVPLSAAQVIGACRQVLADYKVPKRVVWLPDLPRNAYGKVLKRELRRIVATDSDDDFGGVFAGTAAGESATATRHESRLR